ncbi:MAG: hypothetical protein MI744_14565, partial [Pseudomonadales bacterium]|nr:hypothetical protein [Pseudomonadales bacterium]
MDEQAKRYIVRHELTHIKNKEPIHQNHTVNMDQAHRLYPMCRSSYGFAFRRSLAMRNLILLIGMGIVLFTGCV